MEPLLCDKCGEEHEVLKRLAYAEDSYKDLCDECYDKADKKFTYFGGKVRRYGFK